MEDDQVDLYICLNPSAAAWAAGISFFSFFFYMGTLFSCTLCFGFITPSGEEDLPTWVLPLFHLVRVYKLLTRSE